MALIHLICRPASQLKRVRWPRRQIRLTRCRLCCRLVWVNVVAKSTRSYKNAFDRIVLDGEDIEAVLDEEAANLQTLMDETGAPCWAPDAPSDGPCQVNPVGEMSVMAEPAADREEAEAMPAEMSDAVFFSTQFVPIEEQEKFRTILAGRWL